MRAGSPAAKAQRPLALVACCADPSVNPRPNRAIKLLAAMGYRVITLSYPLSQPMPEVEATWVHSRRGLMLGALRRLLAWGIQLATLARINRVLPMSVWGWRLGAAQHRAAMAAEGFAVVVVEDLPLLPLCLQAQAGRGRVVFDAREYYPKEFDGSAWFRLAHAPERVRLLKLCLPAVSGFCTVSPGLARQYEADFRVLPQVVMSTPPLRQAQPRPQTPGVVRMVHHGVANRDRQLERMIEVMQHLDARFSLDLYLTGDPEYIAELRRLAEACPQVRFCAPVAFTWLHAMLTEYDMGFYFLVPSGFNTTFNLPNKFFEFVQARLAIAIGPSPDMAALVQAHRCGVVAPSFEVSAMADTLNALKDTELAVLKQNSDAAAHQLCWEVESQKLRALLEPA